MSAPAAPAASATPARRRRWPRRLLLGALALALLVVLSPLALSLGFVRDLVARKAGEAVGRRVTIRAASAFWGRGVDLEGIVVESGPGFDGPLATVEHVHADLDVLALLGGTVRAAVLVTRPEVAFRTDASGRRNTEGLFPDRGEAEPPAREDRDLDLSLEVRGGALRAFRRGGAPAAEVSGIDARLRRGPGSALEATLAAVAKDARPGGGDAPISATLRRAAGGEGPLAIEVPALDLGRLSPLLEEASGTRIAGRIEAHADGTATAGSSLAGEVRVLASDLEVVAGDGTRVAVAGLEGTARLAADGAATSGEATLEASGVSLRVPSPGGERVFREERITLALSGARAGDGEVRLATGALAVGQAVTASVTKPWRITADGEDLRAVGAATLRADLSRLGALRSHVAALDPFSAGVVEVRAEGVPATGLAVEAEVDATGLSIEPGWISAGGYVEPRLLLRARAVRPPGGDLEVQVLDLASAVVSVPPDPERRTLNLVLGETPRFGGPVHVRVDLEPASRAFGALLGLPRGEPIRGQLSLDGAGEGTAASGGARLALAGRRLVFPASFGGGSAPAELDGAVELAFRRGGTDVKVTSLRGLGLDLAATATVEDGVPAPAAATARGTVDLAAARPWLQPLAALVTYDSLAGTVELDVQLVAERGGRRAKGTVTARGLRYRVDAQRGFLEEPVLTLEHDVFLPPEGGRYTFDAVRLRASALTLELGGGAVDAPDGPVLDATVTLDGDPARLAQQLRPLLGPEQDLAGSGRLGGRLALQGAAGGRTLLVNGAIEPGSWTSGGVSLERGRVTLQRATAKDPQSVTLDLGVNGGTLQGGVNVDVSRDAAPWAARVVAKGLDMAPVVVDRGPGRLLTFVLPAVLPADAAVPVLSGRLDADVQGSASALESPAREASLQGRGYVLMAQGAVKDSTLFRALGGGGLGDAGRVLATAVPEVGQEIAGLMRIAAFSRLESQFEVANRVVAVKQARLDSERVSIQMQGRVTFEQRADLAANLVFTGTTGDRLAKVLPSRTIPLRITGSLDSPRVLPNLSAKDLLTSGLVDRLPGLKDLLPGR